MGGGGSSSPPPAPTVSSWGGQPNYIPQYQSQNDVNLQQLFSGMQGTATSLPQQLAPQYQAYAANITQNPYAAGQQSAANAASAYGLGTLAPMQQQSAAQLQGLGLGAVPAANQLLQAGFDPQQALYNRTQQSLTDQIAAQNAMAGLSGTPYGAGVANQALSNFNIDWQNNLLNRMNAAAQGYGSLTGTIGRDLSGASGLGTAAGATMNTAGTLPYQTSVGQNQNAINALNALSSGTQGAYGLGQTLAGDYSNYLGLGTQASGQFNAAQNAAYQNQLAAYNAQQQANQGMFGALGGLLGGLSSFGSQPSASMFGYNLWGAPPAASGASSLGGDFASTAFM